MRASTPWGDRPGKKEGVGGARVSGPVSVGTREARPLGREGSAGPLRYEQGVIGESWFRRGFAMLEGWRRYSGDVVFCNKRPGRDIG